jgi:hypothetical protein
VVTLRLRSEEPCRTMNLKTAAFSMMNGLTAHPSTRQLVLSAAEGSARTLLVLFIGAMINNIFNYRWIGKRGGIAEVV